MSKIGITFQIQSLDVNNKFTTTGEYKNNRIKFIDNEGNTNYIIFHKNIIEYYKKGNVNMKYKFDLDALTKGEYQVQLYKFDFKISTDEIIHSNNVLQIKYDLYQGEDLVNKTIIVLEYTFLEEE